MFSRCFRFSAAVLFLVLAGCSTPPPSETDGREALANLVERQSDGFIDLIAFTKTNGVLAERGGVDHYRMEYEAEIQFVAPGDIWWGCPLELCFEVLMEPPTFFNSHLYQGKKKGEAFEKEKVEGAIVFRMTENGWRGPDGEIY